MILDVFSDPICPWCYIGKRRLERALDTAPEAERPRVRWRAFMLNPDMPAAGMERNAYQTRKFGGARRAAAFHRAIARAGLEEGVPFAFDGIRRTPSTVAAHRLIGWAGGRDAQDRLVETLFAAYFVEGVDIGRPDRLADAAEASGLDRGDAEDFLDSGEGTGAVLADHDRARRHGIDGVPCFVLDGRYAISGAQSPEALRRVIDTARRTSAA